MGCIVQFYERTFRFANLALYFSLKYCRLGLCDGGGAERRSGTRT